MVKVACYLISSSDYYLKKLNLLAGRIKNDLKVLISKFAKVFVKTDKVARSLCMMTINIPLSLPIHKYAAKINSPHATYAINNAANWL